MLIAKHCNRVLAWIALVWGGSCWHPALTNADDLCGNTNTPAVTQAESPTNGFRMVRIGNPGSLEYRDLEFAVDSLYTGLTSVQRQSVFSRWRIALTEQQASPSRVAIDANNFEALYDYFRLEGSNWNTNPNDTVSVRVGWITSKTADALPLSAYKPLDRAHVDVYLIHPSNPKRLDGQGRPLWDGISPAPFRQTDEDLSSFRGLDDTRGANSIGVVGPPSSQILDLAGTGWTSPTAVYRTNFNHETTHSLPGGRPAYADAYDELLSAGAEAVGGIYGSPKNEFPYTHNLLHTYQLRTAFMAYVTYNFLNTDSSRTLVGMSDDLLRRWRVAALTGTDATSLNGLRDQLSDANCATCSTATYFHPNGVSMPLDERLGVLLHNWRVAMFANSPTTAERQYGYPAWSGFTPYSSVGAWRSFDGLLNDDVVALPAIVSVGNAQTTQELHLSGTRTFRGGSDDLSLSMFGANYWVVRAGSDIQNVNRELVVRVAPLGHIRAIQPGFGGRVYASVISYNHADTSSTEESSLWRHPEWISAISTPQAIEVDSISGEIEVVVPNFGLNTKAATLVLSLSAGRFPGWSGVDVNSKIPSEARAMPYRLGLGLRSPGTSTPLIALQASTTSIEGSPCWSPSGSTLAFHAAISSISPRTQIYRKLINGGVAIRVAPQESLDQFFPDWSPRGNLLVYEGRLANGTSNLWICDPNGGTPSQLTNISACATSPAFQPDGQGIAYLRFDGSTWSLRWIAIDGTGDRLIAAIGTLASDKTRLRWSADGSKIYYNLQAQGGRIAWVPKAGGAWTLSSGASTPCVSFDLHPGVGRVAMAPVAPLPNFSPALGLSGNSIQGTRLALVDTTTSTPDVLFRFNVYDRTATTPRYSPSGTAIAFESNQGADADVYVAQITTNRAPVLSNVQDEGFAACVPFEIPLAASDADGDPITYQVFQKPPGSVLTASNILRWTRPAVGDYFVIIRAIDSRGAVDNRVVLWHVFDDGSCFDALVAGGGGGGALLGGTMAAMSSVAVGDAQVATQDEQQDNTLLDSAPPGVWTSSYSRLPDDLLTAGQGSELRVGNIGTGIVELNRAHVLAVSHGPEEVAVSTGTSVAVGTLTPALGAGPSEAEEHEVPAGASLELEAPSQAGELLISLKCRRTGEPALRNGAGIRVQIPFEGGWRTAGVISPRRLADRFAVRLSGARTIRLIYDVAALVSSVDWLMESPPATSTVVRDTIPLLVAEMGASIDVVAQAQGGPLSLTGGQAMLLSTASGPSAGATNRSYFLYLSARAMGGGVSPDSETAAISTATGDRGTQGMDSALPAAFDLGTPSPNPSRGDVRFSVSVPGAGSVAVDVLDLQGRRVVTLHAGDMNPGVTSMRWNGRDEAGRLAPHGVYMVRMRANGYVGRQSVVLLRH